MTESKLSQTARLLLTISPLDRRKNIFYTEIILGLRMGSICGWGAGRRMCNIAIILKFSVIYYFFDLDHIHGYFT